MIIGRMTSKAQTTVPRAVRAALGLKAGDDMVWALDGNRAVVMRATALDPFDNPFAAFSEWADELDSVYDNL